MSQIDASLVKQLRERSGAGIMDCKQALIQSDGNLEAASDWLRKKGLAAAARRSGRTAGEGVVAIDISADARVGTMIELNSETDFVARNQQFQDLATEIVQLTQGGGELDRIKQSQLPGREYSVADLIASLAGTIGENLILRRSARLAVGPKGMVGYYIHNALGPDMGKIGVLIGLDESKDESKDSPKDEDSPGSSLSSSSGHQPSSSGNYRSQLQTLGKQLAMHIAAARPQVIASGDIAPATLAREREILTEQAQASDKPAAVIEKMVEGRLRKYYEEVALLEQSFMIDSSQRVKEVLAQASKELGITIEVRQFYCFALGAGGEDSAPPAPSAVLPADKDSVLRSS